MNEKLMKSGSGLIGVLEKTRVALDPHGSVPMERLQQVMDNLALQTPADGNPGKPLFPDIALKGVYAP